MARTSMSELVRNRIKRSPGLQSRGSAASDVASNVRSTMASVARDLDEVYTDSQEMFSPISTENRAGWLASIGDAFAEGFTGARQKESSESKSIDDTTVGSLDTGQMSPKPEPVDYTLEVLGIDSDTVKRPKINTEDLDYGETADKVPVLKDPEFTSEAKRVSENLSIPVNWLYSIIDSESGFSPTVRNKEYVKQGREKDAAIGLIQFMPFTAKKLGTSVEELEAMSATEQLKYVEKYYAPFKGKIKSPEDLYVATFYPAALGRSDSFVLGSQTKTPQRSIRAVYSGNSGMDYSGDRRVTLGEVRKWYRKSRGYNRFIKPFEMTSD